MKKMFMVFAALGVILCLALNAQSQEKSLTSNSLDGLWVEYDDMNDITSAFEISGDKINKLISSGGQVVTFESTRNGNDYIFVKKSYQLSNNAIYLWSASCDECVWTETQSYHFSLIDEDFLIVHWKRIVNNQDSGEECYSDDGKCFTDEERSIYRRYFKE